MISATAHGGGGAGSCGALFFLECERCPAVFSNPNGLASAGWPSPLGLLYMTVHSHASKKPSTRCQPDAVRREAMLRRPP
jgi:hypothetical protein